MKIELQRKVDRLIGQPLCRILSLFNWSQKTKRPAKIEKVLVILLSEMGSLVLAYPMFRHIKKLYPDSEINVLLFKKNTDIVELLGVVKSENIFTIDNSSFSKLLKDSLSVIFRLRKKNIDAVIDCELFSRISSIFSLLSGSRLRAGFHSYNQEGLYRGDFINCPVVYNPYNHISRQFITLVEALDSDSFPKAKRAVNSDQLHVPKVHFSDEELFKTKSELYDYAPQLRHKKLVLIYPSGGMLPIRAWPIEYYSVLTEQLISQDYAVGIIGMAEDKSIAQNIIAQIDSEGCIDLTGYTKNIRELLKLFNIASLLITNDGGPGHFAAMSSIPSIILFGPETPLLYGSHDPKSHAFFEQISCSPCVTAYNHRKSACDGKNFCLKLITPQRVFTKAMEILLSQLDDKPNAQHLSKSSINSQRIITIENSHEKTPDKTSVF